MNCRLSRIGGDEFIAILPDLSDSSAALPIIHRLLGDLLVQVSANIGVTFYPQNDGMDADQLIRQAGYNKIIGVHQNKF